MNDNNTNTTMTDSSSIKFVAVTTWLPAAEAKAKRDTLRATYGKDNVKLSSYRWADIKDHDKGYIARVMVNAEVAKPEDVVETRKVAKVKKSKKAEATVSGNTCDNALTLSFYTKRNSVDFTTTTA